MTTTTYPRDNREAQQTFANTYFTDHNTAFALTLQRACEHTTTRACYTVHKTPGVSHWTVYAVNTHGREHCLGQYFANIDYGLQLDAEPSVSAWYHTAWTLLDDWWTHTAFTRTVITPLGYCKRCGRLLTDPRAVARGYGDECFKHAAHDERADWVNALCNSCYYRHCTDDEDLLCHICPVGLDINDDNCLVCSCVLHKAKMLADDSYVCEHYTRRNN